ncbi:conserved hypothetical protein [Xenorhabdus nematophila F1]|nr:conserved hypothetical protein [Xenorhabdus nematophila F1]
MALLYPKQLYPSHFLHFNYAKKNYLNNQLITMKNINLETASIDAFIGNRCDGRVFLFL